MIHYIWPIVSRYIGWKFWIYVQHINLAFWGCGPVNLRATHEYIYIYIYGWPVNLRVHAPRLFKFKKEKVIQWPRQITCYKAIGVATSRSHNESRASLPFAWRTTAHIRSVDITKLPFCHLHYNDVIMGAMASQITSLNIVYSTVYSGADQRKHHSSVSLAFVRGVHRWPVNSPQKWPVTRKMFPFDDVIMCGIFSYSSWVALYRVLAQALH